MEQTFNDLLQERAGQEKGLLPFVLWLFVDTLAGITRENMTAMMVQNKKIKHIALATAAILLLPLIAMQFTDEVVWGLADFVIAGILLFGTGLTYELIARKADKMAHRAAIGVAVATALLLIWMNLAVGIIGNEGNPANLMYVGVLAVGIIGAVIARFRPRGMAKALFATAIAQIMVAVTSQIAGLGFTLILNGFFAVLWVGSALLFLRAGASDPA